MTEIHGQDKKSGAGSWRSEIRQIQRVSRTENLAEESKRRAVEEATRESQESKPGERTGEESRRRALDELEAQNASTSMRKIGRHIFQPRRPLKAIRGVSRKLFHDFSGRFLGAVGSPPGSPGVSRGFWDSSGMHQWSARFTGMGGRSSRTLQV